MEKADDVPSSNSSYSPTCSIGIATPWPWLRTDSIESDRLYPHSGNNPYMFYILQEYSKCGWFRTISVSVDLRDVVRGTCDPRRRDRRTVRVCSMFPTRKSTAIIPANVQRNRWNETTSCVESRQENSVGAFRSRRVQVRQASTRELWPLFWTHLPSASLYSWHQQVTTDRFS